MKKAVLLILCGVVMLCGCADYKEPKDMIFAVGLAVDKENRQYCVTAEIGNMVADGEGVRDRQSSVKIESAADTLDAAVNSLTAKVGGELNFQNCEIFIISKALCDGDLPEIIKYFYENINFQKNILPIVSEEKAKDILESKPQTQETVSEQIYKTVEAASKFMSVTCITSPFNLQSEIELNGFGEVPKVCRSGDGVKANGIYLVNADGILSGLDEEQSVYYFLLSGKFNKAVINECEILSCTKTKKDGRIDLTVDVDGHGGDVLKFTDSTSEKCEEMLELLHSLKLYCDVNSVTVTVK